jgi:hypothetical protein
VKGPSPLLGYNNNVRHKGRVFHIQTEDSGVRHPHVITHLFMDGGRIVKSVKTSYAQHLEDENGHEHVRALMKQQHQSMFRDLRDGKFDYALTPGAAAPPSSRSAPSLEAVPAAATSVSAPPPPPAKPSVTTQAAVSTAHTEPAPPPGAGEEPPVVKVAPAPASARVPASVVLGVPPGGARITDPSAQTMPDLRASAQPPASAVPTVRSAVAPPSAAVRSDAAPQVAQAPEIPEKEPSSETEPSMGDSIVFTAIDEYDPEPAGSVRRRTPPPRSDLPPPPAATLNKARPDGAYRSQVTPTPPPPRSALGSRPAASRPPVGSPSSQAPAPTGRRSLFGDDYVSEKSLDEVILSYLAEDLDSDK